MAGLEIPMDKAVYCTNCGNALEPDEVFVWDDGSLTGMCSGCRHVNSDYTDIYDYDEFGDDECCYLPECTCETCLQNHPEREYLTESANELMARSLRIAVIQSQYDAGNLTEDEAKELLSGPLTPGDESTVIDDSSQLKLKKGIAP